MDLPRIFTIRESSHRIHNPLTAAKLAALGGALQLAPGTRVLDLASGSGEMLCTWARDHGITGTGVDISTAFTEQARAGAAELGVGEQVEFVHGDASGFVAAQPVDLAACVGATWIGNGVAGTTELLGRSLRPGGTMLIGGAVLAADPSGRGDRQGLQRLRHHRFPTAPGPDQPVPGSRVRRRGDDAGRPGQLGPIRRGPVAQPAPLAGPEPRRRTGARGARSTHQRARSLYALHT